MNNTEGLLASYVLRLKDIPLVEFSLYVSYEEIFDSVAENYSIKIKKVHQENKHLLRFHSLFQSISSYQHI